MSNDDERQDEGTVQLAQQEEERRDEAMALAEEHEQRQDVEIDVSDQVESESGCYLILSGDRLVFRSFNEAGHNCTDVDVARLLEVIRNDPRANAKLMEAQRRDRVGIGG